MHGSRGITSRGITSRGNPSCRGITSSTVADVSVLEVSPVAEESPVAEVSLVKEVSQGNTKSVLSLVAEVSW